MKRFLFIPILSLVCFIGLDDLFAQQHYSMLEGNPEWVYYLQAHSQLPDYIKAIANSYIRYKENCFMRVYVSDTVIQNGKVLNHMMCEVLDVEGNRIAPSWTLVGQNPFVLAIFREEDNKALGRMCFLDCRFTNHTPLDDIEHFSNWEDNLLFDFSLDVGDTLYRSHNFYYVKDKDFNFPVMAKQLITLSDGSKRYMTTYKSFFPYSNKQHSIEGIGFIDDDVPPFGALQNAHIAKSVCHWCHLIMFKQNNKVVYIAPREDPEDDGHYEGSRTFKAMPFYPDITPENVASGEYNFDTSVNNQMTDNIQLEERSRYNISGQRINGLQKGLNIVDGKKILAK